ncbi:MAG: contractile injection system protein, VgrG/Pvc8 family [Lentisphaeraceae bacterium]|nr:contractile injection system protein, VgrG/Pvc8 family [Lentisphaeraceae bacterium]
MTPIYKVLANGQDISESLSKASASIKITDNAGIDSDTLSILCSLDNIQVPATGAELKILIGYKSESVSNMGTFVVDEIEISKTTLAITAKAVNFSKKSRTSKNTLKSQKDKSWTNTTIGSIVNEVALKSGYTPLVSPELQAIGIPHRDQLQESDMNFLANLAKDNGAVFKPVSNKLLFVKEGEGKTVSGIQLPTITLKEEQLKPNWKVKVKDREHFESVVAPFYSKSQAKLINVQVGSGEPIYKFSRTFNDEKEAYRAAAAKLKKLNTGDQSLSASLAGNMNILAEAPLHLNLNQNYIATDWIIKSVTHSLTSRGFTTSFSAEVKK